MAGYTDRTIRQDFDELADGIYVVIRNPKLLPEDKLVPRKIRKLANGEFNMDDAARAGAELFASLITDWFVYDATDDSDEPEPLGEATPENVRKLPVMITNWLGEQVEGARRPT